MNQRELVDRFLEVVTAPERKLIKPHKISQARLIADSSHRDIFEVLMEMHLLSIDQITDVLSEITDAPATDPLTESFRMQFSKATLSMVSRRAAVEHQVFPLFLKKGRLHVAMANPTDAVAIEALERMAHYPIKPHVCIPRNILRAVVRYYNLATDKSFENLVQDALDEHSGKKKFTAPPSIWTEPLQQALRREIRLFPDRIEQPREGEVAVSLLVQKIIDNAIYLAASDIHFEPF